MRFPAFPLLIFLLFVGFSTCIKIIYPGTNWCGTGDIAENYHDLGDHASTDSCCREHDHCNKTIEARKTNFGLENKGSFTRSHCSCDRQFYECLHSVKGWDIVTAVHIGIKYFTILSPKCFQYDYPAKCVKHGWLYGRCIKYKYDKSGQKKYQWFENPSYLFPSL